MHGAAARARTALVVDDDPGIGALLQEVLHDEGFAVERVTTGRAALARLAGPAPQVVLLDLVLPDEDGERILATLRQRWGPQVPVIVLSALPQRLETLTQNAALGATTLLVKPFELDDLLALLGRSTGA